MNKNRIGRRLITVLLLFFSIIILLLLVTSYFAHTREVDSLYQDQVTKLSRTAASLMDGDFLVKLREAVSSPKFRELREEAVAEGSPELLEDYLKKEGLYADYTRNTRTLSILLDSTNMESLYVQDLSEAGAMYLLNPGESILSLGLREESAERFGDLTENVRVPATVTSLKHGWLCTCAEPVVASDGTAPAIVGADFRMNGIMDRRHDFAFTMILQSAVILVVTAMMGSIYIRKVISDPIRDLAMKAGAFGTGDEESALQSQVIEVPLRQDDEIQDLYLSFRNMQLGIIRYTENLTAVTEEKERIGTELNIANKIQASMLPSTFPPFPDRTEFDVYALMKPAKSVAGDFYDFFLIDQDHLGIVMADVSGKGIPASLFMMMAKIIISHFAQLGIPPHEVLQKSNDRICVNNNENMFVTVWFGILTLSTGHVIASNAGHEFPVLQDKTGRYDLYHDKHGLVVGGMSGVRYQDYEFDLDPGQTLFLYTDGVPEATTAENEQFGTERMIEALNKKQDADPRELVHYMLRTVDDFDGDVPQFDDITMLALRYNGPVSE
ncbi:MAG TPA: hypothetical protein DHV42_03805 [Lachnospiraceae bacterium]|nr:hypothetical protein [Lachnospiraceae bacterium]